MSRKGKMGDKSRSKLTRVNTSAPLQQLSNKRDPEKSDTESVNSIQSTESQLGFDKRTDLESMKIPARSCNNSKSNLIHESTLSLQSRIERGVSFRNQHGRSLGNERGQLAIFVALIFQVLFVFFAMAINVSLIVHDKINLQNATDLAAYYGAQRQAQILSAIAHVNYQIRQSYKLLAWRYRVLGTVGLEVPSFHPSAYPDPQPEAEWVGASLSVENAGQKYPKICVDFVPSWNPQNPNVRQPPATENACKDTNIDIPKLPQTPIVAGFVPVNALISSIQAEMIKRFTTSCDTQGMWDWWFAKGILMSYRLDQANRRELIKALANNLSRGSNAIVDLDGNSIRAGITATFTKNLTWSNSANQPAIEYFNSMAGMDRSTWLREIFVNPTLYWLDFSPATGCKAFTKLSTEMPFPPNTGASAADWALITGQLGGAQLAYSAEPLDDADSFKTSIGYEKNPWALVYTIVESQAQSRNIFHPFGGPVTLRARSYAKPFGGRIGPWHGATWPPGATQSVGAKLDYLGQPRTKADGMLDSPSDLSRFPNYSRYPGDQLGLSSRLALAASSGLRKNFNGSLDYYLDMYTYYQPGLPNDPLAWNLQGNSGNIRPRQYEIAAIAPDLFDVTYYSIDANYWGNYGARINANRNALGIPDNLVVRPDLGYRAGVDGLESYNVQQQMVLANNETFRMNNAFYYIRDRMHLLTSWLPGPLANNYVPDEGEDSIPVGDSRVPFGTCKDTDYTMTSNTTNNDMPPSPGSCIRGGRTGYSVKIISRDYLQSNAHANGGNGSTGPIINPPEFVRSTGP